MTDDNAGNPPQEGAPPPTPGAVIDPPQGDDPPPVAAAGDDPPPVAAAGDDPPPQEDEDEVGETPTLALRQQRQAAQQTLGGVAAALRKAVLLAEQQKQEAERQKQEAARQLRETEQQQREEALEVMNAAFSNAALMSEFDIPNTGEILLVNGGRFTIEANKYYEEIAGDFKLKAFEKGEDVRGKKTATYNGAVTRTVAAQAVEVPSLQPALTHGMTHSARNLTITANGEYKRTFLNQMWENSKHFTEVTLGSYTEVRGAASVATSMIKSSLTMGPVLRAGGGIITMGTFDIEFGTVETWAVGIWYEKIGILIHQPQVWVNNFGTEQTNWEVIKTKTLSGGQVLQF